MIKLTINDPGLTITLVGLPTVRTPVKIDISKLDVRSVITQLKSLGIQKYEINSYPDLALLKPIAKKVTISNEEKPSIDFRKELSDIKNLLSNLLKNGQKVQNLDDIIPKNLMKKKVKEEVEDFIPSINLDKLELVKKK